MRHRLVSALAAGILSLGIAAADAKTVINVAYENNPGEPVDKVVHYWADQIGRASCRERV